MPRRLDFIEACTADGPHADLHNAGDLRHLQTPTLFKRLPLQLPRLPRERLNE